MEDQQPTPFHRGSINHSLSTSSSLLDSNQQRSTISASTSAPFTVQSFLANHASPTPVQTPSSHTAFIHTSVPRIAEFHSKALPLPEAPPRPDLSTSLLSPPRTATTSSTSLETSKSAPSQICETFDILRNQILVLELNVREAGSVCEEEASDILQERWETVVQVWRILRCSFFQLAITVGQATGKSNKSDNTLNLGNDKTPTQKDPGYSSSWVCTDVPQHIDEYGNVLSNNYRSSTAAAAREISKDASGVLDMEVDEVEQAFVPESDPHSVEKMFALVEVFKEHSPTSSPQSSRSGYTTDSSDLSDFSSSSGSYDVIPTPRINEPLDVSSLGTALAEYLHENNQLGANPYSGILDDVNARSYLNFKHPADVVPTFGRGQPESANQSTPSSSTGMSTDVSKTLPVKRPRLSDPVDTKPRRRHQTHSISFGSWNIDDHFDWDEGYWRCRDPGCQKRNRDPHCRRQYGVYKSDARTSTREISTRAKQHAAKHSINNKVAPVPQIQTVA